MTFKPMTEKQFQARPLGAAKLDPFMRARVEAARAENNRATLVTCLRECLRVSFDHEARDVQADLAAWGWKPSEVERLLNEAMRPPVEDHAAPVTFPKERRKKS